MTEIDSDVEQIKKSLALEFSYVKEFENNLILVKNHLDLLKNIHKNMKGILSRSEDTGSFRERELHEIKDAKEKLKDAWKDLRFVARLEFKANKYEHDLDKEILSLKNKSLADHKNLENLEKKFMTASNMLVMELSKHTGKLWHAFNNVITMLSLLERLVVKKYKFKSIKTRVSHVIEVIEDLLSAVEEVEIWIQGLTGTVEEIKEAGKVRRLHVVN